MTTLSLRRARRNIPLLLLLRRFARLLLLPQESGPRLTSLTSTSSYIRRQSRRPFLLLKTGRQPKSTTRRNTPLLLLHLVPGRPMTTSHCSRRSIPLRLRLVKGIRRRERGEAASVAPAKEQPEAVDVLSPLRRLLAAASLRESSEG